MEELKFIDLFAGLGGFHLALHDLGHNCIFASELNSELFRGFEALVQVSQNIFD